MSEILFTSDMQKLPIDRIGSVWKSHYDLKIVIPDNTYAAVFLGRKVFMKSVIQRW